MHQLLKRTHTLVALVGGLVVFSLSLGTAVLIVNVYSDTQARTMIDAMSASTRTLSFASITATATIIPLMLTILSFANRIDNQFDPLFYRQVRLIAILSSTELILAVVVLLILTIPILETDTLRSWFQTVYYVLVAGVSGIAGLIVAIVLMLYRTLADIIQIVTPE